jgi:Family of unknown function (DUF6114)
VTTERPGAARRFWQGFQRGRRTFRRWRRGRPFWAGVFLILGGLQLFLSTQLNLGDIEISFGPQGFLAILLPVVLVLCGILVWVTPQHRMFYSVIGSVTAVYSLLGLNLGGWFLGMLFGIIGGALGISWTPVTPKPPPAEQVPPPLPPDQAADERPTEDLTGPLVDEPPGTDQTAPVRAPRQDPRTYVAAALPLLLAAVLAAPAPVTQICLPLLCPDEEETPTPSPSPEPEPDPDPDPTGEPEPTPSPAPTDPGEEPTDPTSPTPSPNPSLTPIPTLPPPSGHPLVSSEPALMTADRLDQQDFLFEGITELPTADGPIRVLQFSFSRATATNFSLTTTGEGQPSRVTADPLVLAGDVKFYTDRFSGNALGALPLELTPDSPLVDLLELVDIPLPVFFTDVNLNLVFTNGAELTATGFLLTLP